ncbi:MAG: hypothetical protein A2887_05435 [Alphaproteobacteria bacterium RIFCSPLOWO2_01_FULL_40_26]|nr:MAG: hypothetical protein A3D15_05890 [Alphaproteobacteria bacterium RIFCSPHIGHO2_02_FULL_40_34]OFW85735.1 MAG: hypothetical protein A2794_00715 [Alphaproteobacteria bacterium RIFCSPHIGHO2_01_FULL_40_8]OFW94174.1 MAG: hypothetical protein A2887_05435 [Alphaproteobacteria bacterium RIFCSPLOWO2_01_FULL_40_26]OFX09743.1 MAG: hypothetical protein A3H30_00195 [Alphaproteobacteria bacterium RIFCSPLOWO2_02_FULL_40_19]OFX11451.1 MAG: hypothetical protein A3G22_02060 [Alphaproteobacteria bacterium RI
MKLKRAFSLIELSIVILIIGILVAGITQASRLVAQMKIASARTQTQSAPVTSIKGLMLWLETTMETAFQTSEAEDVANVTLWNDYSPQSVSKNNVSRGTSDNNITYKTNGINGLPSLSFGGSTGATTFLSGTLISNPKDIFTFFLVAKSDDTTSTNYRIAFLNGGTAPSVNGWIYQKGGGGGVNNGKRVLTLWSSIDSAGSNITSNPEIISATYDGTNVKLWANGTAETLNNPSGSIATPITAIYVGNSPNGSYPWQGLIGEIIVFDSVLKNADRKDVEKYLGKKWGVKIN